MSKRELCVVAALLVAFASSFAAQAQVCAPLDNGRLANVYHEGTLLYFEPVVEFREMVLTITGPCEDIVRKFGPKDQISFDIREIERVTDGHYNWTLQRVASIDEGLQKTLEEARGSGKEDALWWDAYQAGKLPEGPYADSGAFTVERGLIIDPASGEEKRTTVAKAGSRASGLAGAVAAGVAGGEGSGGNGNTLATKDFVINDDLIVTGSTCVGFDCVNGEAFGFDTIRLKENNLRIKFEDTSGGSFPSRDWEIEANSSTNGGQSHFRINDVDGARSPFTIVAGAPSHSLHVGSTGRVGLRTSTPVLDLHISTSNTPGMRLEQTNAGGFTAQTWDVAGNEANFFVRDVTGGSRLPFRIRPGAPTSSIDISASGDVGIGTASPAHELHIVATGEAATDVQFKIQANTDPAFDFTEDDTGVTWRFINNNAVLKVVDVGTGADGAEELRLTQAGDLTLTGQIFTSGSCSGGCDLVFAPDYDLPSIEEHAAEMFAKRHLPAVGPTSEDGPFNLSQMTGSMLNELEKAHIYISQLNGELKAKQQKVAEIERTNRELEQGQDELRRQMAELREQLGRLLEPSAE